MSGAVGQKVTLTCIGNANNVGSYSVGWYQQTSQGALKTVMLGTTRPSGIPARISGSDAGNIVSLIISDLQPEDEADYYCSTWDKSINNDTVLQAHGDLRQKPVPMVTGRLWRVWGS